VERTFLEVQNPKLKHKYAEQETQELTPTMHCSRQYFLLNSTLSSCVGCLQQAWQYNKKTTQFILQNSAEATK
jgi:hypothetical protein